MPSGAVGSGAPKARAKLVLPGLPKVAGVPMSNQVSPWLVVSKMLPVLELIRSSLLLTGLTTMLRVARRRGHCGSGTGTPVAGLEQPEGPADAVDLDELGVGPPPPWPGDQYWKRVPLPCWSTAVPEALEIRSRRLCEGDSTWMIAVGDQVGVRGLSADVLGAGVEQGPGDLGRRAARLDRTVVELAELEVAVAIDRRAWRSKCRWWPRTSRCCPGRCRPR